MNEYVPSVQKKTVSPVKLVIGLAVFLLVTGLSAIFGLRRCRRRRAQEAAHEE